MSQVGATGVSGKGDGVGTGEVTVKFELWGLI